MSSKLISLSFVFAGLLAALQVQSQTIPSRPSPPQLVNDFAGLLNTTQRGALEAKLVSFDDTTTNQIAIVTVATLNGADISDYAIKLFHEWGIGNKKKDNGLLLLIAPTERKAWISTGRGLEARVTDALSRRIIETKLIPYTRSGNYFVGCDSTTNALMRLASGEYHETRPRGQVTQTVPGSGLIIVIIIVLILLIIRRGGGGPNQFRSSGSSIPWWLLLGALGSSGRGSSWGGSSWGGGGNDNGGGGGFGGFSGGDTGGGGAGGSW